MNKVSHHFFSRPIHEAAFVPAESDPTPGFSSDEEKIRTCEDQLAHLHRQKELHTQALKEMYQLLCKLETSFRAENQKLRDLIKIEQERSSKLIEVTTGLWEIIDLIENGRNDDSEPFIGLTRQMEDLARLEAEVNDEFAEPVADFPLIEDVAPAMNRFSHWGAAKRELRMAMGQ